MKYIGLIKNWQVYQNSEGFLEGFKSAIKNDKRGQKEETRMAEDSDRVVTTAKTEEEFLLYIKQRKKKEKKYKPDHSCQLKIV